MTGCGDDFEEPLGFNTHFRNTGTIERDRKLQRICHILYIRFLKNLFVAVGLRRSISSTEFISAMSILVIQIAFPGGHFSVACDHQSLSFTPPDFLCDFFVILDRHVTFSELRQSSEIHNHRHCPSGPSFIGVLPIIKFVT
jgi:hypothetical protein